MANREIHYRYGISILLFLLACVTAIRWYEVPNLSNLLGFALSLSSLILAVVAIFQSLFSGETIAQAMASLKTTSDSIRISSEQVQQASAKTLTSISTLSDILRDVPSDIKNIHNKVDAYFPTSSKKSAIQPSRNDQETDMIDVEKIKHESRDAAFDLLDAPPLASIAFLTCLRSFELNRSFNTDDVITDNDFTSFWAHGYIAALWFSTVIDIKQFQTAEKSIIGKLLSYIHR